MDTSHKPRRRVRLWILLGLAITVLLGAAAIIVFIDSQLGVHPDGVRILLANLNGGVAAGAGRIEPVRLPADLEADGLRATGGGSSVEVQQFLILRRERFTERITLTAGKGAIDTATLGYVLLDKDGAELSRGPLQPAMRIEPGQRQTLLIADGHLPEAARIEIQKLP
jgi:hypothetical protein